jgi:hypothetical protein
MSCSRGSITPSFIIVSFVFHISFDNGVEINVASHLSLPCFKYNNIKILRARSLDVRMVVNMHDSPCS